MEKYILDEAMLKEELKKLEANFILLEEVDSTNLYARRLLDEEEIEKVTVIAAREQTGGMGRLGRSFFSPKDMGLYMSILLPIEEDVMPFSTIIAALATARGIKKVSGIETDLKWVNDVYLNKLKTGGILCSYVQAKENTTPSHMIMGIGINLYEDQNDFPSDLDGKVTSLFQETDYKPDINVLVIKIVSELHKLLSKKANKLIEEYKDRCFILGEWITCHPTTKESFKAAAIDVDYKGHLVVKKENGEIQSLNSGEVSIEIK